MWEGMVAVATYINETEARCELGRLTASGIDAMVRTDNCGGMRPHFDLQQGVQLLVPEAEAERARELLTASTDPSAKPWICASCGETGEAGFDACWNCGSART